MLMIKIIIILVLHSFIKYNMIRIIIQSLKFMKDHLIKERNQEKEYYMEENLSILIMKENGKMTNKKQIKMNNKMKLKQTYNKQKFQRKKK